MPAHRSAEDDREKVRTAHHAGHDPEAGDRYYAHARKVEAQAEHVRQDYRWQEGQIGKPIRYDNPDRTDQPPEVTLARIRSALAATLKMPMALAVACPMGHAPVDEFCFTRGVCGPRWSRGLLLAGLRG